MIAISQETNRRKDCWVSSGAAYPEALLLCDLRQPFVACIRNDPKQLLDAMAPDRCYDPELRKVSADDIDHRDLLADEQMTGTVQRQAALLLCVLVATNRMFGRVIAPQIASASVAWFLCRFTYGFTYARWHQPNSVSKRLEFTRPMVRRSTGFDTD
jgi:hypothetical protein